MPNESEPDESAFGNPRSSDATNSNTSTTESPLPITLDHQPNPKKDETLKNPHFKFALGPHITKEDADIAIQAIEGCEVIAMEWVGGTTEERLEDQSYWQELANLPKDSPKASSVLDRMKKASDEGEPGLEYNYHIAKGLVGSGKTILVIDMGEEDQGFNELSEKDKKLHDKYIYSLLDREDIPTILSKLRSSLEASTNFIVAREAIVGEQLRNIASAFKDKSDLSVGVIQGTGHTFASHQMHQQGYSVTREFAQTKGVNEKGIGKRMYQWNTAAIRQMRFFPDKPLTDNFLKRVVASDFFRIPGDNKSKEELASFDSMLEKIPEHALDAMLSSLPRPESTIQTQTIPEKDGGKIDRAKKFLKSRRLQRPHKE